MRVEIRPSICFVAMALALSVGFASDADAAFKTNSLKGVYVFYSDDNSQTSTHGFMEFNGKGKVADGRATIWYVAPIDPPPVEGPANEIKSLFFPILEGSVYSIEEDGTGTIDIVDPVNPGGTVPFSFITTTTNSKSKVLRARVTMQLSNLVPTLDPASEVEPSVITGFIERLSTGKLPPAPEPTM